MCMMWLPYGIINYNNYLKGPTLFRFRTSGPKSVLVLAVENRRTRGDIPSVGSHFLSIILLLIRRLMSKW